MAQVISKVVYEKVTCQCLESYIGESGRPLNNGLNSNNKFREHY